VEQEGVRRARVRAAEADLVLWLVDADGGEIGHQGSAPVWLVRNKIDLGRADGGEGVASSGFRISAARGDGIADLVGALVGFAQDFFGSMEGGLITRERQRRLLMDTAASLERSLAAVGRGEELAAEDLRSAAYSLGRLLGRVDVEDILDVIFREFCIGK
jgi:tRNA modification GTPase